MGRKKTKSAQTKQRRHARRERRRGGVIHTVIAPDDMAFIIRGATGRIQFYQSRAEVRQGNPAFWGHLMRWLFADNEDAGERREILTNDFMRDIEDAQKAKEAAAEEKAVDDAVDEAGVALAAEADGFTPEDGAVGDEAAAKADAILAAAEHPEECGLCDEAAAVVAADSGGELHHGEHLREEG